MREYAVTHAEIMDAFPERVWLARLERGLTVAQAAELTGVDKNTLHKLESGRQVPRGPTILKISRGYDIPVRELLAHPDRRDVAV